jgi:hypothetical protein
VTPVDQNRSMHTESVGTGCQYRGLEAETFLCAIYKHDDRTSHQETFFDFSQSSEDDQNLLADETENIGSEGFR